MKNVITFSILLALIGSLSTAHAQNNGIEFFKGSWNEALEASEKENKPIFVDAYAVWCGPCKWMSANVFTNEDVAKFYNSNFINYKFDMERGEGPEFASKYQIKAYPTLLYIDAEGAVKHRVTGMQQPDPFVKTGEVALTKFE